MHEVIERVVDSTTFMELQSAWARNAIVGLARIGGHSVGIVAQEPSVMAGVIDIDAADKMARFVRMCDCFNIPHRHLCRFSRFLARGRTGTQRHHPPRRQGPVRLF